MNNPLLGQVLGGLFANAAQRRQAPGGFGRMGGGMAGGLGGGLGGAALGGILAGMLGGRGRGRARTGGLAGNRGTLIAMLLPFAMQWVQRNGGLGAVLKRVQDRGYSKQANSWVSTGDNQHLEPQAMDEIVGNDEISRLSQQLGVPQDEVKQGFAEILPEMVNQLTPDGQVRPEADDVLQESIPLMERELRQAEQEPTH
jgi:uncharacterized protein YidB (DUF937 family)